MPQLNGGDGDDLGANDELIAFKDEGEQEEKRNVSAERDLDDVKSSLVNESETNSSSDSEVSSGTRNARNRLVCLWLVLTGLRVHVCRRTGGPSPVPMRRTGPDTAGWWRKV